MKQLHNTVCNRIYIHINITAPSINKSPNFNQNIQISYIIFNFTQDIPSYLFYFSKF
jgi:hypothetical protein